MILRWRLSLYLSYRALSAAEPPLKPSLEEAGILRRLAEASSLVNLQLEGGGEGEAAPEVVEEGGGFRGGAGGGAEEDLAGGGGGEGGGFGGDGDALFRAVGAVGQVGDGETGGGGGEDGVGRGHAVEEPEDFKLGLELVGDAVDDQIGVANGVLDGGDEADVGERFGAEGGAQCLLGVMEVGGHYVFEEDGEAGAGGFKGEPAA